MSRNTKFITTTDEAVCQALIANGFVLLSQIGDAYTFMNSRQNFNFDEIGKGKIRYTNILSL